MPVRKYQPDETDSAEWIARKGPGLGRDDAKAVRQKLVENPNDLECRLLLFGRGFWGHSASYAAHLIWLIDKLPKN
jgi:hypothetical protein